MNDVWKTAIVTAATLIIVCTPAYAQEDSLWIGNTEMKRIRIESETITEICYLVAGVRQMVATEKVTKVVHGDAPADYLLAEEARRRQNWSEAVRRYKSCIEEARAKWVKAYSRFYLGVTFASWGESKPEKLADALKAFEKFLAQHENHRFVPHAISGRAHAAMHSGSDKLAVKSFRELTSERFGRKWSIRGGFGLAQILFHKGDPSAPDKLRKVILDATAENMADTAAAARSLLVEALMKDGSYREAANELENILRNIEGVDKRIIAEAHNRLGECYSKLGGQDCTKKALFEHLRVIVLYSAVSEEYLKALKNSVELLEKLGTEMYRKRADTLREEYRKALESSGN